MQVRNYASGAAGEETKKPLLLHPGENPLETVRGGMHEQGLYCRFSRQRCVQ